MKGIRIAILIAIVVIADQALKFYIKTNYHIGESHNVIGEWFRLYFVENEGMAYGWSFGGQWGKLMLTVFRMGAVIFGVFYIRNIIRKKMHTGFIICVGLIFAGALGNLIDSMFYGMIYEYSSPVAMNVAHIFPEHGYAGFLHGNVVDMLYFPIIRDATFPDWVPIWGGQDFEFFRPIFNIADASISVGIITILLFQKVFFKTTKEEEEIKKKVVANDSVEAVQ